MKLVLASGNSGKLRELDALLAPLGFTLLPQNMLGVPEADEPHPTFVENALAKARHAAQQTGLPSLADDSGLCVAALHGAPGVRSARYAPENGAEHRDQRNNHHLIANLHGIHDRTAWYYCVLVLVRHAHDPQPLIAEGVWHGEIIDTPRGQHGFGYDAHFFLPAQGKTAAELDPVEKNRLSHRGKALHQLVARLQEQSIP